MQPVLDFHRDAVALRDFSRAFSLGERVEKWVAPKPLRWLGGHLGKGCAKGFMEQPGFGSPGPVASNGLN